MRVEVASASPLHWLGASGPRLIEAWWLQASAGCASSLGEQAEAHQHQVGERPRHREQRQTHAERTVHQTH